MKVYSLIIPSLDECVVFTSMDNLRQYAEYWHVSQEEMNILEDTLIYRNESDCLFRIICNDINPYFEGHHYE